MRAALAHAGLKRVALASGGHRGILRGGPRKTIRQRRSGSGCGSRLADRARGEQACDALAQSMVVARQLTTLEACPTAAARKTKRATRYDGAERASDPGESAAYGERCAQEIPGLGMAIDSQGSPNNQPAGRRSTAPKTLAPVPTS